MDIADTKSLFTQRFDAARTAWTQGDEPGAAESLRSAIVAARSDSGLRRELASALLSLGRLSRKLGRAGEAEAEPVLTEALAISEALFGSEDAGLAPVLLELGRLHLQQSQHARAENVLKRLLAIARVKGEEHPDVAAALSDLAFVKRKLGDDASAEALYRDALRIREKVLEPNHTITVGTLERLSETCAARGNFAEALVLLHRALPAREAALGPGHERVRAARSRIAELESQMASASRIVIAPPESARASESVDVALVDPRPTVAVFRAASPEPARRNRTVLYASAGAATVAIAIAALLMVRPSAGSAREPVSKNTSDARRTPAASAPVVTASAARTASIGTNAADMKAAQADSFHAASATPAPTVEAIQREQRAPERARTEIRAPRVEIHLDSVNMPSIPAALSGEAILRSAMERQRASDTDRTETKPDIARPTTVDAENARTSPTIIGRAPVPVFPDALIRSGRREGEVLVRFLVNELGRVDVASMIVEHSDDELFTSAVRDILPSFRFEPAHTLGLGSRPVAAWVSVPFRFTTKKR